MMFVATLFAFVGTLIQAVRSADGLTPGPDRTWKEFAVDNLDALGWALLVVASALAALDEFSAV